MLGFLKNLVGRLVAPPVPNQHAAEVRPTQPHPPAANTGAQPRYDGNGASHSGVGIQLPLDAILNGLPVELQACLTGNESAGQTLSVPLETILPQLARGIVKVPFGTLRQAAPHLFSREASHDQMQVTLPLGEILNRLNPAFLLRRRSQRRVQVPDEVNSPFDSRGRPMANSPAPPTSEPPAEPLPLAGPATTRRSAGLLLSVPPPVRRDSVLQMPSPVRPVAETPSGTPGLIPPLRLQDDLDVPPPTPAAETPESPASTDITPPLILSLASLMEGWPEAVRREIFELTLSEANVVLPIETIEQELKRGRVAFRWKTLRSWLTPPPPARASAQDNTLVELPLQVIAPLFLAGQRQAGQLRRKVTVDENIPNLFFGVPQAETPSGTPADSAVQGNNVHVRNHAPDIIPIRAPQAEVTRGAAAGSRFVARYATPNEIVSRAAALDNVAGALIGLPDGLLVASRLGPDMNADTLAAFLPQIFGKVSQCTKELRMGELNNLTFTVGAIPWELFRINAIFFAVFGHPGQPLPVSQLAGLAAELDHKPK